MRSAVTGGSGPFDTSWLMISLSVIRWSLNLDMQPLPSTMDLVIDYSYLYFVMLIYQIWWGNKYHINVSSNKKLHSFDQPWHVGGELCHILLFLCIYPFSFWITPFNCVVLVILWYDWSNSCQMKLRSVVSILHFYIYHWRGKVGSVNLQANNHVLGTVILQKENAQWDERLYSSETVV